MSGNLFTPKVYAKNEEPVAPVAVSDLSRPVIDLIGTKIIRSAQYLVVIMLFLLPLFFVTGLPASLGFDKVILATVLGLATIILLSLAALRYRDFKTVLPLPLGLFWLVAVVAFLGSFLTGDIQDSLRGSVLEPQTAGFFALMALVMTVPLVLQRSKSMSLKALVFFIAAAAIALLYTLVRLVISADVLALGSFPQITISPVGGFNDLAILAALTVILTLISMLQLPLKRGIQIAASLLIVGALTIMSVVNFFHLWLVVGFFGLLLLVFILSRDTFLYHTPKEVSPPVSPLLIGVTVLVCVVSILFVIAGDFTGARISSVTNINYLEVRPSMTATIDIARSVYGEDVLFGAGPNRFADAWRLYKDPSINQTLFWNTEFTAGYGFVPTTFVALGLLGGGLLVIFHALYLYLGYVMLLKGKASDSFWSYFGIVTFTAATFLWGISYVYVPGATMLLLTAFFTGLSFVAYQALVPTATRTLPLVSSRQRGLLVMAMTIVLIVLSVSTVFSVGKQYVAQADFTNARLEATSPEEFETVTSQAFIQYADDTFINALAQIKLAELQSMLSITEPSEEDQRMFVETAGAAIERANVAVSLDTSNPVSYITLANVYSTLARAGITDAAERAEAQLELARALDPLNPSYPLMSAYMAVQVQDVTKAREKINTALQLKSNFTEALFLLTQIDIAEGNIEAAIATTRQITTLEPNNPTRYYQLGVLLAASQDYDAAISAYNTAITQDPNFANARYMLAMTYLDDKQIEPAIAQLQIVHQTNQDNEQLKSLITQLQTTGIPEIQAPDISNPVTDLTPNQNPDASVSSPVDPDTDLITPVNTINAAPDEAQAATTETAG
jgi:tetratricopeptide (TPR) repeat protein